MLRNKFSIKNRKKLIYAIVLLIVGVFVLIIILSYIKSKQNKYFNQTYLNIINTKQQKETFVKILLPYINQSNKKILNERIFVKKVFQKLGNKPSISKLGYSDRNKLQYLAKEYRVIDILDKKDLLNRINTIPVSMALSQAAVESAWGKSRFAQEGNNIFGQWTYSGKGIIPAKRSKGAKHRIAIYEDLQSAVNSYMLNINSHKAYKEFRDLRSKYNKNGKVFSGLIAITTLHKYSGIGHQYEKVLKKIITSNNFEQYS